jgi:hypothetical protein
MGITVNGLAELKKLAGSDLGTSEWIDVTQERIGTFADATGDHQWIHTDPERAKEGPFGAPIAHGYLTLSLFIPMFTELLDVEGVTTKVNYGLNKVRFPDPCRRAPASAWPRASPESRTCRAACRSRSTAPSRSRERPSLPASCRASRGSTRSGGRI